MSQALAKAEQLYADRGLRARELQGKGQRIIGYLCALTPVEMITAARLTPYGITGSINDPISLADEHLETIACPMTRSALDVALKGHYAFLDGFVMPHACDNIVKLYDIWAHNVKHKYAHFINTPHTMSAPSLTFFEAELGTLRKSLERYVGHEITEDEIRQAIRLHNEQRALVRRLYRLRKPSFASISGSEMTKVMLSVISLPVGEGNELLAETIDELEGRSEMLETKLTPLMLVGTGNHDATFVKMIEEMGAQVVVDDLCFGTKPYWYDVEIDNGPLRALAESYLEKVNCPRTYRQSPGTHEEDLQNRFGYIYNLAQEFGVKGVILYMLHYCDTWGFDAPDLKEYFLRKGLPMLLVEEDYPTISLGTLRTRVQAFLEMID